MYRLSVLAISALLVGCAQTMKIDDSQLGSLQATLKMESPDLAGYVAIPLVSSKVVNVELSKFTGCTGSAQLASEQSQIGKATLTPSQNIQTVPIPAGVELVALGESQEVSGGGTFTCGMAVRFQSEAGTNYTLRVTPHRTFGGGLCKMQLLATVEGKEVPVASAHYATRENQGFWKGDDLNLCK